MSLLSVVNDVAARTQIPVGEFTSIIGNTDPLCRQLFALMKFGGQELASAYRWPELTKTYTFDLVDAQDRYALPVDLDTLIQQTIWNRDQSWPIRGPLTPSEWEVIKSGIAVSEPYNRYKVQGWGSGEFFIDPIPTSAEAGQTLAFQFQSVNWVRPATVWVAGLVAAAGSYSYYGDNIYYTSAGGTCGATAPTHMTGSVSDGTVAWTYVSYDYPHADTDEFILPDRDVSLMLEWRFKKEKGLEYASTQREALDSASQSAVSRSGAQTITFSRRAKQVRLATSLQVPSTGYGS